MEDKLIKRYKSVLLLDLIVLALSICADDFLFIYVLVDAIKNPDTLVKYAEIVSFIVMLAGMVFILVNVIKHIRVKEDIIKYGKEKETNIGTLGVYLMVLAIFMFSYSLIKAISLINSYNLFTLVVVLTLILPAILNGYIAVMTLKLSASFYALKENKNA